jgi:hypothetical protein
MKPHIDSAKFGSIKIEGDVFEYDVMIRLDGEIMKRKKKLSKAIYGTSHKISMDEAEYVYEKDAERLIIGSGHSGMVGLSDEAKKYFKEKGVSVELLSTPKAIKLWNESHGKVIGLFHVTC